VLATPTPPYSFVDEDRSGDDNCSLEESGAELTGVFQVRYVDHEFMTREVDIGENAHVDTTSSRNARQRMTSTLLIKLMFNVAKMNQEAQRMKCCFWLADVSFYDDRSCYLRSDGRTSADGT